MKMITRLKNVFLFNKMIKFREFLLSIQNIIIRNFINIEHVNNT